MTDTEYLETACNAFAVGVLPMPKEWATMPPATRLAHAKGLHAELLKSDKSNDAAFRKQNPRLFPKPVAKLASLPKTAAIRVAFLSPGLLVGGAERWIASLCRHFDRTAIDPVAVLYSQWGHMSPIVERWIPRGIEIRQVATHEMPEACSNADVLVSWGQIALPEFTKNMAIPIVDVQHGTTGFWEQKGLAQAGVDAGAHLVAVGEACLDNFEPAVRDKVTVIENGAEPDRACSRMGRAATRERLGIADNAKVVLFVGRFAEVKNLKGLAAAVRQLPSEWIVVAAGPQYVPCEELAALGSRARILGPVDSPGDLFAAADVFCSPSHHEAHSLAVAEAMLAGVPAVTTDYPAATILHKQHGNVSKLVNLNPDARTLSEAILLADDRGYGGGRLGTMASLAHSVSWQHYTAPAMAARWESYLTERFK